MPIRSLVVLFILLSALSTSAATYEVTSHLDSGPGTLRQGILDANEGTCPVPCEITFGATEREPAGPVAIVDLGTDATGTTAVPNETGVRIENVSVSLGALFDHRIVGPQPQACLISGNRGDGILMTGGVLRATGNLIGSERTGLHPLANGGNGVTATGRGVLENNVISFNVGDGVYFPEEGCAVRGGAIHSNGGRGIRLGDSSVTIPSPVIASARSEDGETRIRYRLDVPKPDSPLINYLVYFYASSFTDTTGSGEGRRSIALALDRVETDGEREIVVLENLAGKFITATAVPFDVFEFVPVGTTTEFSRATQVTTGSCPTIAPIVTTPPRQSASTGPLTFRWTPIDGASEYRVWTMRFGGEPRIAYRGTAPEAAIVFEPGTYDWVVGARFDPCYGTQSEHGIVTVER